MRRLSRSSKAAAAAKRSATGDLRERLWERCGGYCEVTGEPLGDSWAMHHRKLRKHGGPDCLSNLLAVTHQAHNLGTDAIHLHPRRSYDHGWLVQSFANPALTPVAISGRGLVYLTESGEYLSTWPATCDEETA